MVGDFVGGRCLDAQQFSDRSTWKKNSQAIEYCLETYGGTNIIVDSQEITDWVVSRGVGEHWIGADKVPSIFSSGGDFVVFIFDYFNARTMRIFPGKMGHLGTIQIGENMSRF